MIPAKTTHHNWPMVYQTTPVAQTKQDCRNAIVPHVSGECLTSWSRRTRRPKSCYDVMLKREFQKPRQQACIGSVAVCLGQRLIQYIDYEYSDNFIISSASESRQNWAAERYMDGHLHNTRSFEKITKPTFPSIITEFSTGPASTNRCESSTPS